jgi:hypothetical protein
VDEMETAFPRGGADLALNIHSLRR